MVEFSSQVLRVFILTINNKSERNYRGKCLGSPVTSYGGEMQELMHTFHARFYREWIVENISIQQQIKKGHLNKHFIEIAVLVRIGKYWSRFFPRIFLYLACCSVHEPTKKEFDQYIFLQCGPHTSSVAYKCEQDLRLESHLFAH